MPEISFRPLTPVTGADVEGVDLAVDLQPAVVARLRDALLRYKVLVFRDQPMNDARQVALTDVLGGATAAHPIVNGLREAPAVLRTMLSEERPGLAESEVGDPLRGTVPRRLRTEWHIDSTFVANPNSITILRGVEIPSTGGDTLFANLGSALCRSLAIPSRIPRHSEGTTLSARSLAVAPLRRQVGRPRRSPSFGEGPS